MMAQTQVQQDVPPIIGMLPDGVDQQLAQDAGRRIRDIVRTKGGGAKLRSLRFVPASLTRDGNVVQFIVNTAVEPVRSPEGVAQSRAKVLDSVVTVDLGQQHRVTEVHVPFLEVDEG